jgi:hypothetical protein
MIGIAPARLPATLAIVAVIALLAIGLIQLASSSSSSSSAGSAPVLTLAQVDAQLARPLHWQRCTPRPTRS